MGLAERRLILRSGGSAGWRSLVLGAVETVLTGGWGLLLFAAVRLITGRTIAAAAPACYLAAVLLATWVERRCRWRRGSPLLFLGLEAVTTAGNTPGPWRTFARLLLTPPSLLAACAGYLPLVAGRRALPEILSGTMLLTLQPQLDPRPERVMRAERAQSRRLVLSYSLLSLAAGLLVMLVPVRAPGEGGTRHLAEASGLGGEDGALLVYYLDKVQRYPDSLEFHVRLASLYYRNDMEGDLAVELGEIARLDPHHPMLLLGQDLSVDIHRLLQPDSTVSDSAVMAAVSDSAAADSGSTGGEASPGDSAAAPDAPDSVAAQPDAEADSAAAGRQAAPDTAAAERADTLSAPGPQPPSPDSADYDGAPEVEPAPADSAAAEQPGGRPDSLPEPPETEADSLTAPETVMEPAEEAPTPPAGEDGPSPEEPPEEEEADGQSP
ncbi:MAG: hypothetical protein R6U36_06655 [Candidatus Fermentibacteraceae bacterium]